MEFLENLLGSVIYKRKIFKLADGGVLALDWLVHPTDNYEPRDLVICIPGLSGDSREYYCVSSAKACLQHNFDFVVINNRGTSNVPLKVSKQC